MVFQAMLKPRKFTVGFADLSPFYQAKIVTLVESLSEDEGFPWIPLGTDGCDLLIASTEARITPLDHQIVARLIDEDDDEAPASLTLRVPVTRLSLIELLNRAEEKLSASGTKTPEARPYLQVKRLPRQDEAGDAAGAATQKKAFTALGGDMVARPPAEGAVPEPARGFAGGADGSKTNWERFEAYDSAPSPSTWRQRLTDGPVPGEGELPQPVGGGQPFPAPSPEMASPAASRSSTGKSGLDAWSEVAMTLYSLMQNNAQAIAEISIAGTETVNIDFRFRAYQSTAAIEWLPSEPMFTSIRTVQAEPHWPPAFALPGKPIDSFLWFVGANAFRGGAAPWLKPEERYRLQRWPNLTDINHTMEDMRMTALLGNTYMNAVELSSASGIKLEAATRLVNAYSLMGLLQVAVQETSPVPIPTAPAKSKSSPGLFSRLFKKLGR